LLKQEYSRSSKNGNRLSDSFLLKLGIIAQVKIGTCSLVHFWSSEENLIQLKIVLEVDLIWSASSLKRENFRSSDRILAQAKKNVLYSFFIVW